MLLTRAPLGPPPKRKPSFDLHVLGMPPAFVLSQDQTLRFKLGTRSKDQAHLTGPLNATSPKLSKLKSLTA